MKSERVKGKFPQYPADNPSNKFNPKLPPEGRNPSARRKAKSGIDPDAFGNDPSPKFNPKGF